jgi:RNA polymerase sigma factor (sigma-70 family)
LVFSSTDDFTLVRQAAGRSAEAANAKADLLGRYDRAMHQAARTAGFHNRRDHEYDDAVQTAREAFLRGLEHYDPSRGASLYGYAHLRLRGAIDKELVRPRLQRKATTVPLEHAKDLNSPGGIELAEQNEQHQILREFLGTCSAIERKLLYDHYVAGRSFADIARERGVTRTAIKLRHDAVIRRARKSFELDIVHGVAMSHP